MLSRYLPTYVKYSLRKERRNLKALSMPVGVLGAANMMFSALMCSFAIVIRHKIKKV
jgi:hypothetical protein